MSLCRDLLLHHALISALCYHHICPLAIFLWRSKDASSRHCIHCMLESAEGLVDKAHTKRCCEVETLSRGVLPKLTLRGRTSAIRLGADELCIDHTQRESGTIVSWLPTIGLCSSQWSLDTRTLEMQHQRRIDGVDILKEALNQLEPVKWRTAGLSKNWDS